MKTIMPENATEQTVTWASSNASVASVSSEGVVTAVSSGTATITAWASDGEHSAACTVTVQAPTTGNENGHDWVDLGLPSGLKWATCNVGATSPEEIGSSFAWGETSPKSEYGWSTYVWCNGSATTLTKYNTKSEYGSVDNKTALDLADDAAHVNWGGSWRMPTKNEYAELKDNCTWTWTTQNGEKGYRVTSLMNGNSIFMHEWSYWTKSLDTDYPNYACALYLNVNNVIWSYDFRYSGLRVRAVME